MNAQPLFSWFKKTFPRTAFTLRRLRGSRRQEEQRWRGRSTQEVFQTIYAGNEWADNESRSGHGSSAQTTQHIREELPQVISQLEAKTFLDAPCGDFNWMRLCNLGVERYIGADIVPELVDKLQNTYGDGHRSFVHLDIISDPLPDADVLMCRDCFLHLSFSHIHGVLDNFCRSSAKHLIASTYRDVRANVDHFTGGVRMVNLCLPPFNLPEPLKYIEDPGEATFERFLGVWSKEQVMAAHRVATA